MFCITELDMTSIRFLDMDIMEICVLQTLRLSLCKFGNYLTYDFGKDILPFGFKFGFRWGFLKWVYHNICFKLSPT